MAEVFDVMRQRRPFASVDVHNNTGINPHYACINRIDHRFIQLASLFSRTIVYFIRPAGVQSMAFANLCPAVTVECGKVGQSAGIEHACEFLEACLHLSEIPAHPVASHDVNLFHTVATVRIPNDTRFGFDDDANDLVLRSDIDLLNFRELEPGEWFARTRPHVRLGLEVRNEDDADVSDRYFERIGDEIRLAVPAVPSMLTRDLTVIRQDVLCYLMERYPLRTS